MKAKAKSGMVRQVPFPLDLRELGGLLRLT